MLITRVSLLTQETRVKEIDITPAQLKAWEDGMLIQNAMPHLNPSDREFIISGSTDKEWDAAFEEA